MIQTLYSFSRGAIRLLVLVLLSSLGSYLRAQNGAVSATQSFSYTGQIVTWQVPTGVTSLTIEARGAEGGAAASSEAPAGKGAIIAAQVSVTPGQSLSILVGQNLNGQAGGGGGTFVISPGSPGSPTPLVIAGGGGGAGRFGSTASHGQITTSGGRGGGTGGDGGLDGGGGSRGTGGGGGGGGGLLGDGIGGGGGGGGGGKSFVNGGAGGSGDYASTFGGGGGGEKSFTDFTDDSSIGGGGGGYSGGGGGGGAGPAGAGGGGGSFTAGTRLFARTGPTDGNSGNGLATITYVVPTQPIRYVKQGGTGDGSSWNNASGDLQSQINANGVQQVWVAGGTFYPTTGTNRIFFFSLRNGVSVYGGFTGNEQSLSERPRFNPTTGNPSSTTLSGDIGQLGSNADNSYNVIYNQDVDNTALLDGFVISGGNANGTQGSQRGSSGGGIYNSQSSPSLTNLLIQGNAATIGGGIFLSTGSSPRLTNCVIKGNSAASVGAGIADFSGTTSTLINCVISNNSSGQVGGGVSVGTDNTSLNLVNVVISGNAAPSGGGGIFNGGRTTTSVRLTNSILFNNGGANSIFNANGVAPKAEINYSLIESGVTNFTGTANQTISESPFVSPTDYQLAPGSVAIDAGNNEAYTAVVGPTTDLVGNPRIANNRIDIGAYEYQGPFCQPVAITQQPVNGSSVCVGSTITATVSVTGTNPTYQWYKDAQAVGGQISPTLTLTNVQTDQSGRYSVVVTGSCNSVTSTAFSLTVNALPVATLTASPSTTLSCAQISLTLTAGGGSSYVFSGPGVVSQTGNQAVINAPGSYSVTVTSSGCTSTTSIVISQDNTAPAASLTSSGPLSCGVTSVTLTASPEGQSYRFSAGATQIGTTNQATVTTAGIYSVTVISGNSCSSVASTTVTGDQTPPTVSVTPTSGTLTCGSPTLTLTANTTAPILRWSNGQTTSNITVNATGTYSVTATGANGCSAVSNSVLIESAQDVPPATLVASGALSCAVTSVTLTANAGNGLSYRFSSGATQLGNGNTATVNVAGTYSVTVTNTATGCTNTASVVVGQDNSQPTVRIDPTSASLTCGLPSVTLTATTNAPNLRWSTGQTTNSISVSVAGTYSVTVTSANGCMAMAQATVSGTTTAPTAPSLSASPSTTTTNQPIVVTANGCSGGMINWTALGGMGQASGNTYTLTQPGNYTLTATCSLNGCTSGSSAPLAVQIRPGGFAITGVNMVNCQSTNPARGEYQVQFTPQYAGQNASPISFAVVNELAATTATASYSLRLYTDNPVITLVANQAGNGEARFAYNWLASCQSGTSPNQPPTTTGIPSQTIVQNQGYQLQLTSYFSDPDGQALSFQVSGLPAGLSLTGSVISGTPTQTGASTVNVTALDPGGLPVSTSFQLTVAPMPVTPPTGFAIVGVSTVSCQVISAGERRLTFTPQYAGVSGAPISFSVVNELVATTSPGPYSLNLYTDNPAITLSAQQGATVSTYRYNWLAVCTPAARMGNGEAGSRLQVKVLGNPVAGNTAEVEISGVSGQAVQLNLVDGQGKSVHTHRIEQAGQVERVSLPLGASTGVLLLRVSTPTQSQRIKLLAF